MQYPTGDGAPRAEFILVTPQVARDLMQHNENRNMRRSSVQSFERLMRAGEFYPTGDAVMLEWSTKEKVWVLRNAQHRLQAIINTGLSQMMLVVWGMAPEAMMVMDTGKKRSFGDLLVLTNRVKKNVVSVSSLTRLGYLYDADKLTRTVGGGGDEVSPFAMLAWFDAHPEVQEAALFGQQIYDHTGFNGSAAGMAKMIFDRLSPEDCDDFFAKLRTGVADPRSPITAARRWVHNQKAEEKTRPMPRAPEQLAILILAWNYYVDNRSRTYLKYKRNDTYPKPLRPR